MNPARKKSYVLLIVLLTGFGLIPQLWPGDAPWINDEPRLIQIAIESKKTGAIPTHGLWGSRGFQYGPLPAWIYTGLLYVTDDLIDLVRLRALLVTVLTALAIAWLARVIQHLDPWVGALALLSPYVWFYSRLLWDNTFLIPLSALTIAAYVSFCAEPRAWKLWITAIGMTFMFLTHLMSAPVILAIAIHAAWLNRGEIHRRAGHVAAQFAVALTLSFPYLRHLATTPTIASSGQDHSMLKGLVFPLMGGRFFSAFGIDYFFGEEWFVSDFFRYGFLIVFAGIFTWAAIALVWLGMAHAIRCVRGLSSLTVSPSNHDRPAVAAPAQDARVHLSVICLLAVLIQCVLSAVMRTHGHPHYYNATWVCFLYFLWTALSSTQPEGRIPAIPLASKIIYGLALSVVLVFLILNIRHSGGNRGVHYGATLQNQIEVARMLKAYHPDSNIMTDVLNYVRFPHALGVIRAFHGWKGADSGPQRTLEIRYMETEGRTGRLTVREAEAPPSGG